MVQVYETINSIQKVDWELLSSLPETRGHSITFKTREENVFS